MQCRYKVFAIQMLNIRPKFRLEGTARMSGKTTVAHGNLRTALGLLKAWYLSVGAPMH